MWGLLALIAIILLFEHETTTSEPLLTGPPQMVVGVIAGALDGGLLLGVVPEGVLLPMLAAILVYSARQDMAARIAECGLRLMCDEGCRA